MEWSEGLRRHGGWRKDTDEPREEKERDGKGSDWGTGWDDQADRIEERAAGDQPKPIIEEKVDWGKERLRYNDQD